HKIMQLSAGVCLSVISLLSFVAGSIWFVSSLKNGVEPVHSTQPETYSSETYSSETFSVISLAFSSLSLIFFIISTIYVCRIYYLTREVETSVVEINEANAIFPEQSTLNALAMKFSKNLGIY
ncbi:20832_t:CDS:2, partial [Dentiscutata erythropus]